MLKRLLYLSSLLSPLSFLLSTTSAQSHSLKITPVEGQPTAVVMLLMQDSRGFIWMATLSNLLIRYDRSIESFQEYTVEPNYPKTYPHSWIEVLYEDQLGTL